MPQEFLLKKEALKSDKPTAIERLRERVYKVSTLWSEFRHASLVVLKENDEQTGVHGARWHIGENELNKDMYLKPCDVWVCDPLSHVMFLGFTAMKDEDIKAQG